LASGVADSATVDRLTGFAEASIAGSNQPIERFSSNMAVSVTSSEAHDGLVTSGFWALTLGSIGVVFGDIGTSPLYAFREAVAGAAQGQPVTRAIVLGVLSLILWALFIVVTAKYVLLLLRADNNGEGGTLSLMALGQRALGRRSWPLLALGVIGASMFIGDSMITPAISVLSAVEGLKLAAPALEHYVVPLTVFILVVLFSVQSSGTARVASAFGPVMIVWFSTLAVMGLVHISDDPSVLAAINPWYGIHFLLSHGTIGMVTLGAVCGFGSLRTQADPGRMAVFRVAFAPDQLLRPGRAGAFQSGRD
jgi:KUP system potassium uptake protein